ncbi:TPA: biotin transporter BioY, partial [Enterococcus faecalis]|nr:biotin transporter BioY [Enterococcus faecalis]
LIGFIFNGLLTGYILEKTTFNYTWAIIANIAGALVTLVFGMIWLKYSANLPWPNAFAGGFAPFIIPGIIKAVAAAYVGILIRQRFMKRFLAHLS